MRTFKMNGKTYRWNFKKSPLYIPAMLVYTAFMLGTIYFVGVVMCTA